MSALQEIAVDLAAQNAEQDEEGKARREPRPGAVPGGWLAWFEGLSIGRKIQVFYTGNLAFALLAGVFVVFGYMHLGDRTEQIAAEHDLALDAERLVGVLSEAQRHAELLVARGENIRTEAALEKLDAADKALSDLRVQLGSVDAASVERIAQIQSGVDDFRRQVRGFDAASPDEIRRASRAGEVQARGSLVLEAARDLADRLSQKAKMMSDSGSALISTLMISWVGFAAILTVLTLVAQRYFDRNVGGAIKGMTAEMNKLASGDSELRISGRSRRDEIGEMARALAIFHSAGKRLERLARERAEKAKAELDEQTKRQEQQQEARREREEMLRDVADKLESTVGDVVSGVAEASTQLQTTSQMMAKTAEESSRRAGEVSVSMSEANSGATAAAAASDEFAMSIGEISRQAASSAELARKATVSATQADTTISALSDSAQQVGQIVELIQTIAQRTNLLALNASIEAARGGEAGRGFAVVASEVKELAMQTSRATEQVAEQIRAMQDTTGASVTALRSIASQVQELETTAVSIASAVDQQSVAGQDLARSIDMAARGTEQVTGHIADVRDLSLSTGSAASQVLSSATNLENQAVVLRGQVDAFLAKVRVA
ncbi:MAG: methyl-accepting chemotaxis protein [Pseudomonadota bacterium]